jgi:hypothetical protein
MLEWNNVDKLKVSFGLILILLGSTLIYSSFQDAKPLGAHDKVIISIIDSSGVQEYLNENTITDIGERYERNALGFANCTGAGTLNATKWISCGNATVSQTLTKLTTELLEP